MYPRTPSLRRPLLPRVVPRLRRAALVLCGTRDLLHPGCRLPADRASTARWAMTCVERPGLSHVHPLPPGIPEARTAARAVAELVR